MSEVSRRAALTAVTAGAALALAGNAAGSSPSQDTKSEGVSAGWGQGADQAFKLTEGRGEIKLGVFSDNCEQIKEEIRRRFQVYRFGSCNHPSPVDADVEAAVLMAYVIADGGIINTEFGHRTVKHKVGPISYNTYLAYAGGNRP